MGEFSPFTCFLLEIVAQIYIKFGIVDWINLISLSLSFLQEIESMFLTWAIPVVFKTI